MAAPIMDHSLLKELIYQVGTSRGLVEALETTRISYLKLISVLVAGGLATGADEVKTEEDRRRFGGVANAILDPCYHQVGIGMWYHSVSNLQVVLVVDAMGKFYSPYAFVRGL